MKRQQQETLETLRIAAKQDQWNICREILTKLLPDLEQTDLIRIVVKQAQHFLFDLSRAHPADEDIAKAIDTLANIASLEELGRQGQLINPLLDQHWNWPGVSNFRNAFKGILRPEQYFEHSGEYVDTIVSFLLNMLIAIEANHTWGGNPEFSTTFFGPDIRKAVFMLAKHHSDPERIAFRASLWAEVVSDLDAALQAM